MRTAALILLASLCALAVGCKKKPDTGTDESVRIVPGSDLERFQGVWGVEKMDSGRRVEDFPPEEVARAMESLKQSRFQFDSKSVSMNLLGRQERASFVLDETQNPKAMYLTESREGGPASNRSEWIYKFEGDYLVLAFAEGGQRPTEFKARAGQPVQRGVPEERGIHVIWLKKSDELPKPDPGPHRSPSHRLGATPK